MRARSEKLVLGRTVIVSEILHSPLSNKFAERILIQTFVLHSLLEVCEMLFRSRLEQHPVPLLENLCPQFEAGLVLVTVWAAVNNAALLCCEVLAPY